jgi:hypothetical protein
MLGQIRRIQRALSLGLIVAFGFALGSCATHKEVALVEDPDKKESSIPWNKQEKWENTGPLSGLTDRR